MRSAGRRRRRRRSTDRFRAEAYGDRHTPHREERETVPMSVTEPTRNHSSRRRAKSSVAILTAVLLLAVAMFAIGVAPASASVGQQEAWGEFGLGNGKLFDPGMMGVNSEDGSIF